MTPETQVPVAAHDGFDTYDELNGPGLDPALWVPARLPLPTGGEHVPLERNAELSVGEGELRVTISRFSLWHQRSQAPTALNTSSSPLASSSCRRTDPRRSPSTSRSRTSARNRGTTAAEWPPSTSSTL
jgi:hypothetical protein